LPVSTLTAPAPKRSTIDFIQLLRGIAAVLVVLYHYRHDVTDPFAAYGFHSLFVNAPVGVDIFFVVSGFIMWVTTSKLSGGMADAASFVGKRFARIWPLYALFSLVFVFAVPHEAGYLANPGTYDNLLSSLRFQPLATNNGPWLGFASLFVGWSLNYEAWFYVALGASLLFKRLRWPAFGALIGYFLIVVPLMHGRLSFDGYNDYLFPVRYLNVVANPIIWDFLFGLVIGWLYQSRFSLPGQRSARALLALAVTLFAAQYLIGFHAGHGITRWGPSVILLVLALAAADKQTPLRIHPVFLWLGNISYSLYLVHIIARDWLGAAFRAIGEEAFTHMLSFATLSLLASIGLATFSYRYLEQPLARWFKLVGVWINSKLTDSDAVKTPRYQPDLVYPRT
jgi:exopolysaccharide production protein ExoZ